MVKKILISQPRPTSDKSPYFDIEREYGVDLVFRPFVQVEGITSKEFRQQKVSIPNYTFLFTELLCYRCWHVTGVWSWGLAFSASLKLQAREPIVCRARPFGM